MSGKTVHELVADLDRLIKENVSIRDQILASLAPASQARKPRAKRKTTHGIETKIIEYLSEHGPAKAPAICRGVKAGIEKVYPALVRLAESPHEQVRRVTWKWELTDGPQSCAMIEDEIERLIRAEPHTHGELIVLTGSRRGLVDGVLQQLAKHKGAIQVQVGGRQRGNPWFIPAQ